jgi:hypothetical protein
VIVRILNFVVIGALILAAAYVYRIKFEATVQAEQLARLRDQVRHERDKIAALRAEWGELDDPARIQALAERFLKLKPINVTQFDDLDHLPDQPPDYLRPGAADPIGGIIKHLEAPPLVTGSVPTAGAATGSAPAAAASSAGTALDPAPAAASPPLTIAPTASGAPTP